MGLTIAILIGPGVGVTAFFATRKSSVEKPNLPVLASICAAALTLFVVTFAFLAVSASQALASARKETFNEAGALRELWWATLPMPAAEQERTQGLIKDYTQQVIEHEWPAMARGETSVPTQETLNSLRMHLGEVVRDDPAVRAEARSRIHDVYTARRARVSNVSVGIPTVMLVGLAGSAAVAVGCVLLVGFHRIGGPVSRSGCWQRRLASGCI